MGANAVNSMVEAVAPRVQAAVGGQVRLRILSNLADQRLARARAAIPVHLLGGGRFDGAEVADRIHEAWAFADADPYRATTHNKGIMNGVDAVAIATGNDWRGIEAGAHAYAAKTGRDVPDGEWGTLVVTTLDRDNGLLRYDLEEAASVIREPCSCGETTYRGFWGGRFKDFLDCQGKYFQVGEVERALRTVGEVVEPSLEYVVVKPTDPSASLAVRVELGDGDQAVVAGRCRDAIKTEVGVDAEVEVVERQSLERSGYKAIRLVDA
jgi:hypothetical protein